MGSFSYKILKLDSIHIIGAIKVKNDDLRGKHNRKKKFSVYGFGK